MLGVFSLLSLSTGLRGYVETCGSCKLDLMPTLKSFLFATGNGTDVYEDLDVRVVHGHNPDLVVGATTRVDLSPYQDHAALYALFQSHGFTSRPDGLRNKDARCYPWRGKGECLKNPSFMADYCARACSYDADARCPDWARMGECHGNKEYMYVHCPVSCDKRKGEL